VSTDLRRARLETGAVLEMERLDGGLIELTARLPHLAAETRPGEFAQLRCSTGFSPLLRRPFSVAWTEGDTCAFVFEVVGAGTALLAQLAPGDDLDVLGPLGSGYTLEVPPGRVLCISGGLGCAPFPILAAALRRRGVEDIIVLNGAATASRLYPAARFQRGDDGIRVIEATDDGTRGHRGFVTQLVAETLTSGTAAVFACGPNSMLVSLARLLMATAEAPAIGEASLEAPMGCGFGTCLGCALPVLASGRDRAWALCCSDGPVMAMRDVDWNGIEALPEPSVA